MFSKVYFLCEYALLKQTCNASHLLKAETNLHTNEMGLLIFELRIKSWLDI